jgi:hypothetical protein
MLYFEYTYLNSTFSYEFTSKNDLPTKENVLDLIRSQVHTIYHQREGYYTVLIELPYPNTMRHIFFNLWYHKNHPAYSSLKKLFPEPVSLGKETLIDKESPETLAQAIGYIETIFYHEKKHLEVVRKMNRTFNSGFFGIFRK